MSEIMSYTTYIFDLDGTLLNTLDDLKNAVNFTMKQMNYPERTLDEVRSFVGNGMNMLVRRAVPNETSDEDFDKAYGIFNKYYIEHIADFTRPYDGVIDVVKKLKANGKKTAVITNKAHDAAQIVVKNFFGDIFDVTVGKKDCFKPKPSSEPVNYAMDLLGSNKDECIYIGDSDVDVQTAHNSGLKCIGVTWGFRDRNVLKDAGAEFIIDSAEEILKF